MTGALSRETWGAPGTYSQLDGLAVFVLPVIHSLPSSRNPGPYLRPRPNIQINLEFISEQHGWQEDRDMANTNRGILHPALPSGAAVTLPHGSNLPILEPPPNARQHPNRPFGVSRKMQYSI